MSTSTKDKPTIRFRGTYCHEVKYFDGDTLSLDSIKSKPRETICIILKLLAAARNVEAHSFWSGHCNGYVVDKQTMDELCEVIGKVTQ